MLVGEIKAQRRQRDTAAFDGPAIGTLFRFLDRLLDQPEMFPSHRVEPRCNGPHIVAHRLARPLETGRGLIGKVGKVYGLRLGKRSNADYGQGTNTGFGNWIAIDPTAIGCVYLSIFLAKVPWQDHAAFLIAQIAFFRCQAP